MGRAQARLYLVISAVLWSMSGAFVKSLPEVHWLALAGVRSAFGCLVFIGGIRARRPPLPKLALAVGLYLFVVGALMGAMQLGTAAQGIWLQYIAPAVVALWMWRVQKQRLRRTEVLAVALTVVALVLIVAGGRGTAHWQSVGLGIISGFAFGAFVLVLKNMGDVPPSSIFLWTNLGTAAILLPLLTPLHIAFPTAPRDLTLIAVMGAGQLCLPYWFFKRGLVHTRAVEASLIALLEPILNPVWVFLLVREVPAPQVLAGCGLIALGLVAFAFSPQEQAAVEGEEGSVAAALLASEARDE
jgi:drug/metabolite transporter, DME family